VSDPDAGPGHITREWTVWCGGCSSWYTCGTENTLKDAIVNFRAYGWRKVGKKWFCKWCHHNLKKRAPG
jgi:hypothetical protein